MQTQSNTLGNFSLGIGILSATTIFGVILCTAAGIAQKWIQVAGVPLFICASTVAFLAVIGVFLGVIGLLGANKPRGVAIAGLILSTLAVCMFLAALASLGK
jgi:hypothetical protein